MAAAVVVLSSSFANSRAIQTLVLTLVCPWSYPRIENSNNAALCSLQVPLLRDYALHLQEVIKKGVEHPQHPEQPLKGFKIVVDAGNGSGGFFADQVSLRVYVA
jgi:phosphomannomutase